MRSRNCSVSNLYVVSIPKRRCKRPISSLAASALNIDLPHEL